MLKQARKIGIVLWAAVALAAASANAQPQREPARAGAKPPRIVQQPKPRPAERNMLGMPNAWVDRLRTMTPQQQERFFNNNARFRALPPQQQAQIRQRLQVLNNMTPQQKERFEQQAEVWNRLPAEQQSYVRDTLLPEWKGMAPMRRQAILAKLRNLRGLSDEQRTAKLNDEAFLSGLDPGERNMLRDLSNLRVGAPDDAGEAVP
jgi:hypothetical protein